MLQLLETVQISFNQDDDHTSSAHNLSPPVLFLSNRPIRIWVLFYSDGFTIEQFGVETLNIFCRMKTLHEIFWIQDQ